MVGLKLGKIFIFLSATIMFKKCRCLQKGVEPSRRDDYHQTRRGHGLEDLNTCVFDPAR